MVADQANKAHISLPLPLTMPSSVSSLDGLSSAGSSYDDDEEEHYRIAQQEWEDSLNQLQQLVAVVLLPFFGKWLGRRWSHIAYARYLRVGLGKAFFFGERRKA